MSNFLSGRTSLTTVQTADIADNAITLDKLAHQADGSILTFGTDTAPTLLAPDTSGEALVTKGAGALPAFESVGGGAGSILEVVPLVCDGRSVTVGSGTYTAQDVTAKQEPTASYADLTGSLLAYTPPSGAQAVIYDFHYGYGYEDGQHIHHLKFYIDSDEVTNARRNSSAYGYTDHLDTFRWIITIGDGNETATGKLASWSSSKTLKLQVRAYNASYISKLHETDYWDGGSADHLQVPTLTVTAID
jgi:hypothetical protein